MARASGGSGPLAAIPKATRITDGTAAIGVIYIGAIAASRERGPLAEAGIAVGLRVIQALLSIFH
jgi:hypothetical protein